MKRDRRGFLKSGALATGACMGYPYIASSSNRHRSVGAGVQLRYYPYTLQLKHAFGVSNHTRTTTPVVLTEIEYDGIVGYGEASMPPYLGESHDTVLAFLQKVDLSLFNDPFRIEEILQYIDDLAPGNKAAKACIDIALHDLLGKIMNQPWHRIWGLSAEKTPYTSFTIGLDIPEVVREKTLEAAAFKILKVKLTKGNDKDMINAVRSVTDVPLCVDVNQGWTDKHYALEMMHWMKEHGVVFCEQPMPLQAIDDMAWVTQHSPLPTMGDESVQRLSDVKKSWQVFHGINIKLMKCTGLYEAVKMVQVARALDMKVMLGCMTETSCAVSAMSQLAPLADWADLDGNLLIYNDVFTGMQVVNGKVTLNNMAGIGVRKR